MIGTSLPEVDLAHLTSRLKTIFGTHEPLGAVVGRTRLRDAIVLELGCSQAQAEELLDMMIGRKMLVFEGPPGAPGVWHIGP